MRILLVDHVSKVLGGAEVNVLELLAHPAVRSEWDVRVACAPGSPLERKVSELDWPREPHQFSDALNELRVVGRRFNPIAKWRGWQELHQATRRLANTVSRVRPDVLLSCTNKDHFAAGAVARVARIPSVWWINDIVSADFFSWPVRRIFANRARRLATRLAPVSDFGRAALVAAGIPADRCRTIHNGIPLDRYQRHPNPPLRRELGLAPDLPLFGLVGRITPWKGQDFFIQLAAEWARLGKPGVFVIIGRAFNEDAGFDQAIRAEVIARGLIERVRFVAFQPDVAAALSSLDVLVHTSTKPEPFGRVLIEAMAVNTPVVAARGGGTPEIISDGLTGRLVTPADLPGYVEALGDALRIGPTRWAPAAARDVAARFSLNRVVADFNEVLHSTLPAADATHRRSARS